MASRLKKTFSTIRASRNRHSANAPGVNVLSHTCMSLDYLEELNEKIVSEEKFPGIELAEATENLKKGKDGKHKLTMECEKGDTILITEKDEDGRVWKGILLSAQREGVQLQGESKEHQFAFDANKVRIKDRNKWSLGDVYYMEVLPMVMENKGAYSEVVETMTKSEKGSYLIAPHSSTFSRMLKACREESVRRGKKEKNHAIWHEVFCLNHFYFANPEVDEEQAIVVVNRIIDVGLFLEMNRLGAAFLYIQNWKVMNSLKSLWCLWEVFGVLQTQKQLTLIFPPKAKESFDDAIKTDFEAVVKKLNRVSVQKANALGAHAKHEKRLRRAIAERAKLDVVIFNRAISSELNDWIIRYTLDLAAKLDKENGGGGDADEEAEKELDGEVPHEADENIEHYEHMAGGEDDEINRVVWQLLVSACLHTFKYTVYNYLIVRNHVIKIERMARNLFESDSVEMAKSFYVKGTFLELDKQYETALEVLTIAAEIQQNKLGQTAQDTLATLHSMSQLYKHLGRYDQAIKLAMEVLDNSVVMYGSDTSPYLVKEYINLGELMSLNGDYHLAEKLYRKALEVDQKHRGQQHPDVARDLNDIGESLMKQSKLEDAEKFFDRAMKIFKHVFGKQSSALATVLSNKAILKEEQGKYDEAMAYIRDALAMDRNTLGKNHHHVGRDLATMASIAAKLEQYSQAVKLCQEAMQIIKNNFGEESTQVAVLLNNTATYLEKMGDMENAEALRRECLEIGIAALGEKHPHIATWKDNLASTLRRLGKFDEAEQFSAEALELSTAVFGHDHQEVAKHLWNRARLLHAEGDNEKALEAWEEALEIFKKALGEEHPTTVKCSEWWSTQVGTLENKE